VKTINSAQIHRHDNKVAIWLEGQETIYLTVGQAKGLTSALKHCAKDISENTEIRSTFKTFRILP
jgi:hypothetical protein